MIYDKNSRTAIFVPRVEEDFMKITSMTLFGQEIRRRRKELGYTQSELSENTGLSASFLSNLENGKETIEMGKALRITQLLGMDLFMEKRA